MLKIVAAAIRIPVQEEFKEIYWKGDRSYPDYLIISSPPPARHHTIMHPTSERVGFNVKGEDQGFLTSHGDFVSREAAYGIAFHAGQIVETHSPGILYSEDLW